MASLPSGAAWQTAVDELAIQNLVARLAQAADDRDETAYRNCFARTVATDTGGQRRHVPAEEYTRASMARLTRAEWTHHKLVNPVIRVDASGLHASASIDVVVEIADLRADAGCRRTTIGGRYDLDLVLQDEGWRINRRDVRWRYSDGDTEAERGL